MKRCAHRWVILFAAGLPTLGAWAQTNAPSPATPAPVAASASAPPSTEPDHGVGEANHIKALMGQGQMDQALAEAKAQVEKFPNEAVSWYSLGDVLLNGGRKDEALAAFQKCDALKPDIGPNLFEMGVAQGQLGHFDDAVATLSRAIDQLPDYEPAFVNLVNFYQAKQDPVGAENRLQDFIKAHPQSAMGWYGLARVQSGEQLPDLAIDSLSKAVALKPDFADAYKQLGMAYAHTQQFDKAVDSEARAAAYDPSGENFNNLGYTFLLMGQTDKAVDALKQAINKDPKYERAYVNLVNAAINQKNFDLARQVCAQLAQLDPPAAAQFDGKIPAEVAAPTTPAPAPSTNVVTTAPAPVASAPAALIPLTTTAPPVAPTATDTATPAGLIPLTTTAPPVPSTTTDTTTPAGLIPLTTTAAPVAETATATPAPATKSTLALIPLTTTAPPPPDTTTAATGTSNAVSYAIGPPQAWVQALDPDAVATSAPGRARGGVEYILVDNQASVSPAATFTHYTTRLTNEEGLQAGADLRAEFDPNYQSLTLHWLRVKRDGVWQDRLARDTFQLIRREQNLDMQMLDGRYSAICHLQDVRPGDEVDFAFTVAGANPVFNGLFVDSFPISFSLPVHTFSTRVIVPPHRSIPFKRLGPGIDPEHESQPDGSEVLTWKQNDLPEVQPDVGVPTWYDTFSRVQLSEYASWKDVVDWGLATFSLDDPPSSALQDKVREISLAHNSGEERALAAIDFVQNDVRYLGMELGAGSYKPTPAGQVLDHRFGDCKDKTQLCVELLRALGLEAYPALVNVERRAKVGDLLPSPLDFDHAIVQLTLDGQVYWIDVTRTGQRGRLRDHYCDDFGSALVLKPGTTDLTPVAVSEAALPRLHVEYVFTTTSYTDPAELTIHLNYGGGLAEGMRLSFDESGPEEESKDYLDYYSRIYPKLAVKQALRFKDNPEQNQFDVWLDYTVTDLWARDPVSGHWKADFTPYSIVNALGESPPSQRTTPFRLGYPNDVTADIDLHLFEPWPIVTTPVYMQTPQFLFTATKSVDGNNVHCECHYVARAAEVQPEDLPKFNTKAQELRNYLENGLFSTQVDAAIAAVAAATSGAGGFVVHNSTVWIIVGVDVVIVAALAAWLFSLSAPYEVYRDARGLEFYEGLGGWLVLVGINIVVGIVSHVIATLNYIHIFADEARWHDMTTPGNKLYEPMWAVTMYYEWATLVLAGLVTVLATVLFFMKKFTFPRLMIAFMVARLLIQMVDQYLASQIHSLPEFARIASGGAIVTTIFGCAIWIPYFIRSRRVRATFTE
jgi:tetratricopeptide (TPR) repeat protein/transglutaminase-like putative cysteine protease